jgi:hypothetical protein
VLGEFVRELIRLCFDSHLLCKVNIIYLPFDLTFSSLVFVVKLNV